MGNMNRQNTDLENTTQKNTACETDTPTIKDYVLDDKQLNQLNTSVRKKVTSMPTITTYRVIMESGCDFVVERLETDPDKNKEKREQLVILVSQAQYYIHKSDGKIRNLTKRLFRNFLDNAMPIPLPHVNWLPHLSSVNVSDLYELLDQTRHNSGLQQLLKKGYLVYIRSRDYPYDAYDPGFPNNAYMAGIWESSYMLANREELSNLDLPFISGYPYYFKGYSHTEPLPYMENFFNTSMPLFLRSLYEASPQLYTSIIDLLAAHHGCTRRELFEKHIATLDPREPDELVLHSFYSFLLIKLAFSLEWAKKAVEAYIKSGIEYMLPFRYIARLLYNSTDMCCADEEYYAALRPAYRFHADSFLEYLFHGCVQQGFADRPEDFVYFWGNALMFQKCLYGKIREKYPKNLASYEHQLFYLARKNQGKIRQELWNEAADHMLPYEYEGGQYCIICPKCTADLATEATNQSNCVLNYERSVMSGEKMIFFMRPSDPLHRNESLVTIEVANGRIVQAKQQFNRLPTPEQIEFITEWAHAKNLEAINGFDGANAFEPFDPFNPFDPFHVNAADIPLVPGPDAFVELPF